jgi:hypothetical protein
VSIVGDSGEECWGRKSIRGRNEQPAASKLAYPLDLQLIVVCYTLR